MNYRQELDQIVQRFGNQRFSVEDMNHYRMEQGREPMNTKQMIIMVSLLKKKYPVGIQYAHEPRGTKTYFKIQPLTDSEE